MCFLTSLLTTFLAITTLTFGSPLDGRYLFLSTPDGAQFEGRSGNAILIFDIDDGHKFVKRIAMPIFEEGVRGFTGSLKNHAVYYSTTNRRLGAFDVEKEAVIWDKTYESGCDRSSITLDGKKIYCPTGQWNEEEDGGFLVINAENGEFIKRLYIGPKAHNSFVSLDDRYVFLCTTTTLTMFDTRDESIVRQIKDVGESGIFPYTVTSDNSIAYVCLGDHVGFDVVDLKQGKRLHRVFANPGNPIENRSHGATLTPDGTELWIDDRQHNRTFYFDATQMPPKQLGHVNLSMGGHGWVTFSLDGKYVYTHTPDVFDRKTRKLIATLKDETDTPVASSKFIEIHFRNGKVVDMGNEFGLGRK